jgi:titin
LVIHSFDSDGIQLDTSGGNTITCNLIGTDDDGTTDLGNSEHGIFVSNIPNNTIGGTSDSERNLLSGNGNHGISIQSSSATGNVVQGNYIGTDVNGTSALGNSWSGINLQDAPSNTIGGTSPGARNLISGNTWHGVRIYGATSTGNLIQGNYIGTGATGSETLGNSRYGVNIASDASDNDIGGTSSDQANVIAHNSWDGIYVSAGTGNLFAYNSIFDNGGLGIDLGSDGPNTNDADDPDAGPNNLQNYPVLDSVIPSSGQTTVAGTLDSTPNTTFRLEFFYNSAQDPSGYGEGETFLGSASVTTDGNGDAAFSETFPTELTTGTPVSATATDPDNNTSEFSGFLPTAILLASFATYEQDGLVVVEWETATEIDLMGFHLYRADQPTAALQRLNTELIPSQSPGGPVGAHYRFVDESVKPGKTYYYWLEDLDIYGTTTRHGPVSVTTRGYRYFLPIIGR